MTQSTAPRPSTTTRDDPEAAARAERPRRPPHLSATTPTAAGLDQIARRLPATAYAFCDWLTFRAQLARPRPPVNGGHILAIDANGHTEWQSARRMELRASHETTVLARCDGDTVEISGNLGRLGRPDNVLGAPVRDCLAIAAGVLWEHAGIDLRGATVTFSRIDLTTMLRAGTPARRDLALRALAPRRAGRYLRATRYANGGLTWASSRQRITVYDKAAELKRHAKRVEPDPELLAELDVYGALRLEVQLRAEHLRRYSLRYPDAWPRGSEATPLATIMEHLRMNEPITEQELPDLAPRELGVWHAWRDGVPMWDRLLAAHSRRTAYRVRAAIRRATGDDISQPPPHAPANDEPGEAVALEQWLPPTAYRFASPYLSRAGNARITRILHTAPRPFRRGER